MSYTLPAPRESIKGVGTVKKLLQQQGINVFTPSSEKIANSFAAGASTFRCYLQGGDVITADEGLGADPETHADAKVIHNDKKPSSLKQGFAGVGLSMSDSFETNLAGISISLSKTRATPLFYHRRDWHTIMHSEVVPPIQVQPVDARIDQFVQKLWDDHAINKDQGFLTYSSNCEKYVGELSASLVSPDPRKNILTRLGMDYYMALQSGKHIVFVSGNETHVVKPIDPLAWDRIPEAWRREREIQVWQNGDNIQLYVMEDGLLHKARSVKRGSKMTSKLEPVNEQQAGEKISTIPFCAAYHNNWASVQTEIDYRDVTVVQWLSGTYFVRNPHSECPKIIDHHEARTLKSEMGTKQTVRSNSRFTVAFDAVPCDQPLLAVTFNKQKLDAEQFDPNFQRMLEALQESFVDYAYENKDALPGLAPLTLKVKIAPSDTLSVSSDDATVASVRAPESVAMHVPRANERFGISIDGGHGILRIMKELDPSAPAWWTFKNAELATANLKKVWQKTLLSCADRETALRFLETQKLAYGPFNKQ